MKTSSSRRRHAGELAALVTVALITALLALLSPATASAAEPPTCPAAAGSGVECDGNVPIVPSLDPEWSAQFVPPEQPFTRAALLCLPLDAVFYAQTDWLRLAQKLRGDASACANYYVSIPPLTADKTKPRSGEAVKIRALGPQMHAINDIQPAAWTTYAATNGWYEAGLEARRRMATAGFDIVAGDIWGVNEFSSAVRTGVGPTRSNMREFVRGLYTGDGTPVQGLVWVAGIGQPTTFLDVYKTNLKAWLGDTAFWADMSLYVKYFSQEVYAGLSNWAMPGTSTEERRGPLADYLEQLAHLAGHAPADLSAMSAYVGRADAPAGNAAWPRPAYGWPPIATPAPYDLAQAFITAQVDAFRHEQANRPLQMWGFAWAPSNPATEPQIPDFVNKAGWILDRLAAAIHASDVPGDLSAMPACGPNGSWCLGDLDGSWFNLAWHSFNTWTQPLASDSAVTVQENVSTDVTLTASDADGDPLTYAIVAPPQHGTLSGSGPTVTYTPAPAYAGPDSFTFKANDGVMDSRVATVSVTVNAPPVVTLDVAGPIDEGATPITLTAHASDPEGQAVTLTWTTDAGTLVQTGDTATFAADDGPTTAHVTVNADDGSGGKASAMLAVVVNNVPPTVDAGLDATGVWGIPITLIGSASDPSAADAKAGLSASWSFGDGTASDDLQASHTYADPGTYTATLAVRDKDGGTGFDSAVVTVGARPATLTNGTSATVDAASAVLTARLGDGLDANSARLAGHRVTLTLGSSTCSATTDVSGIARCTLDEPPLGPGTVTAQFAGDALYTAADTSAPVLLYGLPAGGVFAVGDASASGEVTFWSPSWWLANTLSGGAAPASFKGLTQASAPSRGLYWTASPGFDHAPAAVPEWMAVIVASKVTKNESTIRGDTVRVVVVHVDAYDKALLGRGTVVATVG